jgi:lactobin A/cerein 7B family class IIb bacteriocin
MKNTVINKSTYIQEMNKEQLETINGGILWYVALAGVAAGIAAANGWKKLCDSINEVGQEVGSALND